MPKIGKKSVLETENGPETTGWAKFGQKTEKSGKINLG